MSSWLTSRSQGWLWAKCLAIAAGLAIIGILKAPPDAAALQEVSGKVERVTNESRKNVGAFHVLHLRLPAGGTAKVLVHTGMASEAELRDLIGSRVTTRVWCNDRVYEIRSNGEYVLPLAQAQEFANAEMNLMLMLAGILASIGMALGIFTSRWADEIWE